MKSKNIYEHLTEISNSRGGGIKQLRDGMTIEFLRKKFAWLFSANIDEAILSGFSSVYRISFASLTDAL